ncbi:ABC transporter permease [Acuticoccus kandeliae]|uniref:ABC transporter permease n=1 Tax=Acuticoccus kandeliae TaxID=2073160 RepID=UPI000D3EA0E7|nr:ABC transporter permease [Acuticoccus kandeliae]
MSAGAWAKERRRTRNLILAVPLVAILGLFIGPLLTLLVLSFSGEAGPTLANYAELGKPLYARLSLFTVRLSLTITLVCLLIGYPIAYLIAVVGGVFARWTVAFVVLSLWLSILTRTFGWVVLLQRNGPINQLIVGSGLSGKPLSLVYNELGVVIGMVHLLLPFMVVALIPSIRALDPRLVRAALSLGASPARTFAKIVLPLTLPGLAAGSILVFTMAVGYFVTPAILGGGRATTIAMAIRNQVQVLVNLPLAAATSVALLVVSLGALLLYERLSGVDRLFAGREP